MSSSHKGSNPPNPFVDVSRIILKFERHGFRVSREVAERMARCHELCKVDVDAMIFDFCCWAYRRAGNIHLREEDFEEYLEEIGLTCRYV